MKEKLNVILDLIASLGNKVLPHLKKLYSVVTEWPLWMKLLLLVIAAGAAFFVRARREYTDTRIYPGTVHRRQFMRTLYCILFAGAMLYIFPEGNPSQTTLRVLGGAVILLIINLLGSLFSGNAWMIPLHILNVAAYFMIGIYATSPDAKITNKTIWIGLMLVLYLVVWLIDTHFVSTRQTRAARRREKKERRKRKAAEAERDKAEKAAQKVQKKAQSTARSTTQNSTARSKTQNNTAGSTASSAPDKTKTGEEDSWANLSAEERKRRSMLFFEDRSRDTTYEELIPGTSYNYRVKEHMALVDMLQAGELAVISNELRAILGQIVFKPGKGAAMVWVKHYDPEKDVVKSETFRSLERVPVRESIRKEVEYLGSSTDDVTDLQELVKMDARDRTFRFRELETNKTFEKKISRGIVKQLQFVKNGDHLMAIYRPDGEFICFIPPKFVKLRVEKLIDFPFETNLEDAAKIALLETGANINVPESVKEGQYIEINTETGELSRQKT